MPYIGFKDYYLEVAKGEVPGMLLMGCLSSMVIDAKLAIAQQKAQSQASPIAMPHPAAIDAINKKRGPN